MQRFVIFWIFIATCNFDFCQALTQSDGYNIGVILGSILGALFAILIIGFIFYMFCIRRWLGVGEPAQLGYARQGDYKKNQKAPSGGGNRFGYGVQGKAAPYSGGGGGGAVFG